jgi:prepilin-type N-terminal cleavage/methylation domain-containing protein
MSTRVANDQRVARRGFSMIEVMVATLIVGIMMVAAMNTFGAFIRGEHRLALQSRGWLLAQDLASEILACLYEESDGTPSFGRETGESSNLRAAYDDVDDYDGWQCSPPKNRDGSTIADHTGWTRTATVDWVALANPELVVAAEQGLKLIVVEVKFQDEVVARLTALRAKAWQEPPFN